jgi:amino acid transporter
LIPIFGVISCLPAIMFTFDGFYIPTHTFNEMRKPNKGPLAICIGIIIIAAIYILIVTGI